MTRRLGLAQGSGGLALALTVGCFSSQGPARSVDPPRPDAGPPGVDAGPPRPDAGPGTCAPLAADEVRHTRWVLEGDVATVTVGAREVDGCACTPVVSTAPGPSIVFEACDCCESCECIDPGYDGTVRFPGWPVGVHTVGLPGGEAVRFEVVPRSACGAGAVVTDVAASASWPYLPAGPEATWLRVSGHVLTCCPDDVPEVALRDAPTMPGTRAVDALHCDRCALDCLVPAAVPFEAWHPLLDLGPGDHEVVVGGRPTTVVVP